MADRLGQDWASNDNSVWLAKFKSSPGHFKWQSIKSAMNCLGLFLHSLINFSGIKSCPLLFAITINILIIHRFQTRNRSRNIGKFCRHSPIHSWYLSQPPQAAVVYFFQSGAFFARRMQNFGQFWTIMLFCCEFTHFLVYFYRAKICGGAQNWRISDMHLSLPPQLSSHQVMT